MRYIITAVWAVPATICVAVIWFAVAVSNYSFGAAQGTGDIIPFFGIGVTSSQLNGYSSVAVDGLMTTLVIVAFVAASNGSRWLSAVCGAMAAFCVLWSLASVFGYTLTGRSGAADVRGHAMTQWSAVDKQLSESLKQQAMTPDHRPIAVVKADLERARADERFVDTSACSMRLQGRVRFCEGYRGLLSEEAAASSAVELQSRVDKLRVEADGRKRVTSTDPTGDMLNATMGVSGDTYGMGRAMVASVLFITLSALGFGIIWRAVQLSLRNDSTSETPITLAGKIASDRPDLSRDRQTTPMSLASVILTKPLENKAAIDNTTAMSSVIADVIIPATSVIEASPDTTNVITPPQFEGRLTWMTRTEKKSVRSTGDVAKWIADCCNTSDDRRHFVTTQEARLSYVAWCEEHNLHPTGHKKQSRQMRVILRCAVQKDGRGAIFPGLQIARMGTGKVALAR